MPAKNWPGRACLQQTSHGQTGMEVRANLAFPVLARLAQLLPQ